MLHQLIIQPCTKEPLYKAPRMNHHSSFYYIPNPRISVQWEEGGKAHCKNLWGEPCPPWGAFNIDNTSQFKLRQTNQSGSIPLISGNQKKGQAQRKGLYLSANMLLKACTLHTCKQILCK